MLPESRLLISTSPVSAGFSASNSAATDCLAPSSTCGAGAAASADMNHGERS